jgi:hypothetical protein
MIGVVTAVSRSATHTSGKASCERIRLLATWASKATRLGVTVKHRSR